ncbi:MAG: carboxypeptidase regulatory-like domain-containing protein [Chitinispirillaceae bacterium]|nr:carboxypeptidase regulatory-like domain-containing protein [Chitinispirillaceae bacterium]
MTRESLRVCLLMLTSVTFIHGFDISLSGTVKDEQGKPVADAKVTTTYYQYSDLTDKVVTKTDSLGNFKLEVSNLSIRHQERFYLNAVTQFSIKNNILNFTTSSQVVSGRLELLTLDGKKAISVPLQRSVRGRQSVHLPSNHSYGLYILRLNVNGVIYIGNLLCLGPWKHSLTGFEYKQPGGKSALINENIIIDTLLVTKKNCIDTRIPIESYTESDLSPLLSAGVLRKYFQLSDTIIEGWRPGRSTPDSSFTLWNTSDIYSNINGGGVKYVVNGMLQAADLCMEGPKNSDGSFQMLVAQSSFIMDFGTDNAAQKMYHYIKEDCFDSDASTLPGLSDSIAFVTTALSGITLYSYSKQFYFELCLGNFPTTEGAITIGKTFLDCFISRIE